MSSPALKSRNRHLLTRLARRLGYAYPLALLACVLALRFGASRSAFLSAALYLPPHGYLLPLVLLLPLALFARDFRVWTATGAGALLAVFGPMGLSLHFPSAGRAQLTIVTMNVDSGNWGVPETVRSILKHAPDLVLLQEAGWRGREFETELGRALPHSVVYDQFVISSRFPISELETPSAELIRGRERTPHFIRVKAELPWGPIAVYNVHPISPRPAFAAIRGHGFRAEILSGRIFGRAAQDSVWKNVEIREFELSRAASRAGQEKLPVVLAGDLNLPNNSLFLTRSLGFLRDAFSAAGLGFGYTYPAKWPFLRLDRVLLSPSIQVKNVSVGERGYSDHLPLVTQLEF